MNDLPNQDFHHVVIPFSRRGPPEEVLGPDCNRLKSEVMEAVREGAATADETMVVEHDRQAIVDERTFIARFGFDLPRRYRESLIRLKHTVDLTDREIRLLGFTSSLRLGAHGVQLAASCSLAVFGRAAIGILAFQMLYAWLLAAHSSSPAPILVLKLVGVAAMLAVMGWSIYQIYVQPWLIQKRVRGLLRS